MSADPPQVLNTGIFAGYQNAVVIDSQFIEVLHFSILFTWILSIMMTHRSTTIFQTLLTLIYLLYLLLNMLVLSLQVKISTCRNSRTILPPKFKDKGKISYCMVWVALARLRFALNSLKKTLTCENLHISIVIQTNQLIQGSLTYSGLMLLQRKVLNLCSCKYPQPTVLHQMADPQQDLLLIGFLKGPTF